MKTLKRVAIAFAFMAIISCKQEKNEADVVTIDTTEASEQKTIADNATLEKVQFNIEGMTCAVGCAAKIEKSLNNMDGVKSAKVDFETKTAVVEYDVDQVNTDLLTKRVVANGDSYKVANFSPVSAKSCSAMGSKKCAVKCSADCTKKDCEKCAAKTAECKTKCASKKLEKKACCAKDAKKCTVKCSPECTKKDCEKCAAKTAECKAKCAAKKTENKTCKPDCKKACCKAKSE
jgi:copper chaperone CopZ